MHTMYVNRHAVWHNGLIINVIWLLTSCRVMTYGYGLASSLSARLPGLPENVQVNSQQRIYISLKMLLLKSCLES
jgi:hypothetical protein